MNNFSKGFMIGFSIAAVVGPISLLCIRRTLAYGRLAGFASGLGAAMGDAFYGAVAGFGLTVISNFLLAHQDAFRLVGGLFLCYLGITTFLSKPPTAIQDTKKRNLLGDFISTFALTITNPLTILSFMAVFAGFSFATTTPNYFSALLLVCGVFVSAATWWFILTSTIGFLKSSLKPQSMVLINRCSGALIFAFGFYLLMNIFG